jgi:long-chain acyl-CoA synthetase
MKSFQTPSLDSVLNRIYHAENQPAIYWRGTELTYSDFAKLIDFWINELSIQGIGPGSVCAFKGDYSPNICALMFALMRVGAILVPFTSEVSAEIDSFAKIAGVEYFYEFDQGDNYRLSRLEATAPELIKSFKARMRPGLVVFTSGSTGKPKGILHDCELVLRKFEKPRQSWRTILFLLMDHFGGFNTFLATFANVGFAICPEGRSISAVAKAIESAKADLLPTTPTFLNLMIVNKISRSYDFSSIRLITYGTELMSEATLHQCREMFPNALLKQTYGLSELGVLRSDSANKDSVWVKIGGPGFEVKVIDNVLWVRSESNMVGYLNADSPFDDEGWMCTGDQVEEKDGFFRFMGRKSEVINVGGKKVYPIEVENILMLAPNIKYATVFGKVNSITGQVVHAQITLFESEDIQALSERLRKFCNERMAQYKVPIRFVVINDDEHYNRRFKKSRIEKQVPTEGV